MTLLPKHIAILCSLGSASLFSFTHVIIKMLGNDLNAYHLAFWNDVFALITVALFSTPLGGFKKTLTSPHKPFHLLRAFCLTIGYLLLIISVTKMPIANTYSLFFMAPIWGVILAALFLKEHMKLFHIIVLMLGFAGVIIILQPGYTQFNTDMIYPLLAALCFSGAMVFGRKIPPTETKLSFAFYPLIVTLFVTGLLSLSDFSIPSFHQLGMLAASGFMAGFAVLLAGLAYAKAAAAIVAPFEYVQMVWGVLFGYLLFNTLLDITTASGSLLIIISGLLLIFSEKKQEP